MKRAIRYCGAAVLIAGALSLSPVALGQEAVSQVTTTTNAGGTITEFTPGGDTVVLRTETSSLPIRYEYTKTTTVVDQDGNPVDVSVIKTGVPVQVFYDQDGDRMIARKIVVRRTEPVDPGTVIKKTTTTTTTTGPAPQ